MKHKSWHHYQAAALILCLTALLCSCHKTDDRKSHTKNDNDNNDQSVETYIEETTTSDTYRSNIPEYLLPGTTTWFTNKELELTPTGDFSMYVLSDGTSVLHAPAYIDISTNYECEDGFKNVVAVASVDISGVINSTFWVSSFDKYTGTSFELNDNTNYIYDGCNYYNEGDINVDIMNCSYTFHIQTEIMMDERIAVITYIITCPVEYDGTILQLGAQTSNESYNAVFDGHTLYADDFTYLYGAYNYFSMEGIPPDAR